MISNFLKSWTSTSYFSSSSGSSITRGQYSPFIDNYHEPKPSELFIDSGSHMCARPVVKTPYIQKKKYNLKEDYTCNHTMDSSL